MGVWWRWVVRRRVGNNWSFTDACVWWKRAIRGRVAANRSLVGESGRWSGVGGGLRSAGYEDCIRIESVF
jgi:hypothetical protein